jgi:PilZ domain
MEENEQEIPVSVREMQAGLERLERREWWRWAVALFIMLMLTIGVFSLSLPGHRKEALTGLQFDMAVPGLIALVLVFDFFAIYQQILISRLRRQISGQIGMMAALEALKPTSKAHTDRQKDRRSKRRHAYDQRLRIKLMGPGKYALYVGRVIDLSEGGLAAVLPASLEPGEQVALEFNGAPEDPILALPATVRYANGFRHGCEFFGLNDSEIAQIKRACKAAENTALALKS